MSFTPINGPGYEIIGADEGIPSTSAQQLMRARQPIPHNPEHPHSPWDRDDLLGPEAPPTEPNWIGQPPYVVEYDKGYEEWLHGERWQGLKP